MDTDSHGLGAVANVLGAGFLEKVYERALLREYVGEYLADLVVEEKRPALSWTLHYHRCQWLSLTTCATRLSRHFGRVLTQMG